TEASLQLKRATRIGHPVFRHPSNGLDRVGDVLGDFTLDLAFLTRLQIRGQSLAAFLDQARNVARQCLDIDIADLGRIHGWLVHPRFAHVPTTKVTGPRRSCKPWRMVSPSLR